MITLQLTDIVAIPVVGALLSLLFQLVKDKFGANSTTNKFIIILASIVLGTIYYLFSGTELFISIVGILGVASTVYALFRSDKTIDELI